jgi:SNF2 family DNA or RNA helicase
MSADADALLPLWDKMTYYEHQVDGIHWMLMKETEGTTVAAKGHTVFGGLQCDDMGLGKTIQILATMRNNPQPKTLLLCPLAMVDTWLSTATKAKFSCFKVEGKVGRRSWAHIPSSAKPRPGRPALYITNYDQLIHRPSLLLGLEHAWDRIVCDEAHKLRNAKSVLSVRARQIKAPLRWAVTGTPIVNSFRDASSLFAFLGVPVDKTFSWQPPFYELIGELVLHRSMKEIRGKVPGLPPVPLFKTETLEFASPEEAELYRACQGLVDTLKYQRDRLTAQETLVLLMRLRQLSVSPRVYTESMKQKDPEYELSWTAPSTKMIALANAITTAPHTSKFIVFCSFLKEMEYLQEHLQATVPSLAEDSSVELYHGGLSASERDATIHRAKTPACKVILIQLQSGGVGLNLQEFDQVVFMSPWWTAALMDQAIARAVRIGQTKVVTVTHLRLAVEESMNIDEIMSEKADKKREFLDKFFSYRSSVEDALAWAGAEAMDPDATADTDEDPL